MKFWCVVIFGVSQFALGVPGDLSNLLSQFEIPGRFTVPQTTSSEKKCDNFEGKWKVVCLKSSSSVISPINEPEDEIRQLGCSFVWWKSQAIPYIFVGGSNSRSVSREKYSGTLNQDASWVSDGKTLNLISTYVGSSAAGDSRRVVSNWVETLEKGQSNDEGKKTLIHRIVMSTTDFNKESMTHSQGSDETFVCTYTEI